MGTRPFFATDNPQSALESIRATRQSTTVNTFLSCGRDDSFREGGGSIWTVTAHSRHERSQSVGKTATSEAFLGSAVMPEPVLHEAKGFADITSLRSNVNPTAPRVLQLMVEVMATVPHTDTRLVNLYDNPVPPTR